MICRNYITYKHPETGKIQKDIVWFGRIPYGKVNSLVCAEHVICSEGLTITDIATSASGKFKNYVEKQAGVAACLTEKLSVLRGELWYNLAFGLPLLDNYNSRGSMDAEVINIVNSNTDVLRILEFKSILNKHNYSCTIKILSTFGELIINY